MPYYCNIFSEYSDIADIFYLRSYFQGGEKIIGPKLMSQLIEKVRGKAQTTFKIKFSKDFIPMYKIVCKLKTRSD
jgi:hypothetical protein